MDPKQSNVDAAKTLETNANAEKSAKKAERIEEIKPDAWQTISR